MGTFTLDTSTLGGEGATQQESIIEGRGRSITLKWSSAELDDDFEMLGYAIRFFDAEGESKESV